MPFDFAAARQTMVESQVRPNDVTYVALQAAMRVIPRELFCGGATHLAYADAEVEYAPGRWLLRPRDIAKLLQAVRPVSGERALAIQAPYAAAVLSMMGLTVDQLSPAGPAEPVGTGYDVIVCEGGVAQTPRTWLDALAVGGRLGVIEREGVSGVAKVYLRSNDDIGSRPAFDAAPPIMRGFEKSPSFAF